MVKVTVYFANVAPAISMHFEGATCLDSVRTLWHRLRSASRIVLSTGECQWVATNLDWSLVNLIPRPVRTSPDGELAPRSLWYVEMNRTYEEAAKLVLPPGWVVSDVSDDDFGAYREDNAAWVRGVRHINVNHENHLEPYCFRAKVPGYEGKEFGLHELGAACRWCDTLLTHHVAVG